MAAMPNRTRLLATVFLPILIGCIAILNISHRPRFAAFHNVDVLTLVAAGMCFGVALAALLAHVRGPRTL